MKSHSELPESSPKLFRGKIEDVSASVNEIAEDVNEIAEETPKSFSSLPTAILAMASSIYIVLRYGFGAFSRQWGHGGDFIFLLTLAFGVLSLLLSCILFYLVFNSIKQHRAKGKQ